MLKDKYPNASYYRPDGVLLSPYIAISEQERTDMQSSIGTLAHELGHYLGLPDLYDVVYADDNPWSQYSTSFLCLMDAGSWGYTEDGRSIPTALSAACRYLLGWLDSIIVTYSESLLISPQDFSAPPNNSGYVVAKIPIDGRDDEFYLVENRRYSGWDEALKPYYGSSNPNGGLVFWHIDMSIFDKDPENVNGTDHHQAIMPLFIEKKANGDIAFIGDSPNIKLAFFDAELWNSLYASALGDYLVLPQYGTDPDNDVPSARTLSQLKVSFAAAEGDSVLIRLADKPPDPATPTKGSPSEAKAALPATGDPLQAGTFAALFGCSLALLSICLLRRRFKSR